MLGLTGIGLITMVFNLVIDPVVGGITFLILLVMGGLGFRSIARRMVIYFVGFLSEFVPAIDALPLRTISLFIAIWLMVKEDQEKEKITEEETEELLDQQAYQSESTIDQLKSEEAMS
ncbi:MAG: hypothetical protein KatS3mg093_171 [Candidatus Parcubacteria bacterium]|nr:MAG: hypothetical protein KatS3mg093_171 [Candidatus Parcubacteria bacterium]